MNLTKLSAAGLFIATVSFNNTSVADTADSADSGVSEPQYATTADLVVEKDFLLAADYQLSVRFQPQEPRSVYLSVCTDFIESEGGITVDYGSCLLRTSTQSSYQGTLTIANDKTRVVMAIWYLNDIDNPRYAIWENDGKTGLKTFTVL